MHMKNYYTKSMELFQKLSSKSKLSYISKIINYYNNSNHKFFSKEQQIFYQDIINEGWYSIERFGLFVVHKTFFDFDFSTEQYNEIKSHLYLTYRDQICKYDRDKGTPTTFFCPHFCRAIRSYINFIYNTPSDYYKTKLKIIDSVIFELKFQNKIPTVKEISEITEFTEKVVENAMKQRIYHQPTTLEKAYYIGDYSTDPADISIRKEKIKYLYNILKDAYLHKKKLKSKISSRKLRYIYEEISDYIKEYNINV